MTDEKESLELKYRPKTFDEIAGRKNKEVAKTVQAVLNFGNKRIFLFHGPPGCGKTSLARIIAHEVSADKFLIEEKDSASERGVDDIKKVIEDCKWGLFRWQVVFLDEAHNITPPAQEILLKSLEEPPENTWFVLATTNLKKILPTVQSRCSKHELFALERDELKGLLRDVASRDGIPITEDEIQRIVDQAKLDQIPDNRQALIKLEELKALRIKEGKIQVKKEERTVQAPEEQPKEEQTRPTPSKEEATNILLERTKQKHLIKEIEKKEPQPIPVTEPLETEMKREPTTEAHPEQQEANKQESPIITAEIIKQPEVSDEEIETLLVYATTFHLENLDNLKRATALYGQVESYVPVIKAIWYILHGQIIKTRKVELGDVWNDCRMNFVFCMKSGSGKKEISVVIDKVCKELGESIAKPTSYHPEQMIGKVIERRERGQVVYNEIRGHLSNDILIFDDAKKLVRSQKENYDESRQKMLMALDKYGENEVEKRQVNIPPEYALRYRPECSIQLLVQKYSIPDEIVKSGFLRRFIFLLPQIAYDPNAFVQKVLADGTSRSEAIKIVVDSLKELKETERETFVFTKEARTRFNELHLLLIEFAEGYGKKVANFAKDFGFSFQDLFLKMAAILANSCKRSEISMTDVEMAYVDLIEFLDSHFRYVQRMVRKPVDDDTKQPTGRDAEMLQWLEKQHAHSFATSEISIKQYQAEIVKKYEVSPDNARNLYRKHVQEGWISSKREGAYSSRVWLTIDIRDDDEMERGKKGRAVTEYHNIIASQTEGKEKHIEISGLLAEEKKEKYERLPLYPSYPPEKPEPQLRLPLKYNSHTESQTQFQKCLYNLMRTVPKRDKAGEERLRRLQMVLLQGFDYNPYLRLVHETDKRLTFNFLFADTLSRWTIDKIRTGYKLDVAFLKEERGKPRKWVQEFHTKRAKELVRLLGTAESK